MRFSGWSAALVLCVSAASAADDAPIPTTLRLRPSKPTAASAKVRLIPADAERTAGNAADDLRKAFDLVGPDEFRSDRGKFERLAGAWADKSYDALQQAIRRGDERDEIGRGVVQFAEPLFPDLHRAARRRECDWVPQAVPGRGPFSNYQAPEVWKLRRVFPFLIVAAELDLARGDFASAERSLQTAMVLARWIGKRNDWLSCIAAGALEGYVDKGVEHWIQTPNSPNLHEALAAVPAPWIDPAATFDAERRLTHYAGAAVGPKDAPPVGDSTWRKMFRSTVGVYEYSESKVPLELEAARSIRAVDDLLVRHGVRRNSFVAIAHALALAPAARRGLAGRGVPEADLDRMSAEELVLRWTFDDYRRQAEVWFAWSHLPFPQAAAKQGAFLDRLQAHPATPGAFPLARIHLQEMYFLRWCQQWRLQRRAMLRIVELVRWSAAERGVWPKSLDELPLPAPTDPVSGEPFHFVREGARLMLSSPKHSLPRPSFLSDDFDSRYLLELSDLPAAAAPPKPAP